MSLTRLRDALISVGVPVHHFEAQNATGNYIVWGEDGQGNGSYADDKMVDQTIEGTIDYFTKTEYDPAFNLIQKALNSADISWRFNSIQHERDTGYIHYEWVWEVDNSIGEDDF